MVEFVKLPKCSTEDTRSWLACSSRHCTGTSRTRLLVMTLTDEGGGGGGISIDADNIQVRSSSSSSISEKRACRDNETGSNALLSVVVHVSTPCSAAGAADAAARRNLTLTRWMKKCAATGVCHLSPESANMCAMTVFWLTMVSMAYTLHYILIPALFADSSAQRLVFSLVSWTLLAQVIVNWLLATHLRASVVRPTVAPVDTRFLDGWDSCPLCQLYAPPRAHHCRACGVCVFKREHHCYFTGTCVAFANQRRHVALALHVTLVSILCLALIIAHLSTWLPPSASGGSRGWTYLPPVALWQWYFAALPSDHALLLVLLYVSLVTLMKSASFFCCQMMLIYRGQTTHEFERDVLRYRADVSRNFRSVFGPTWWLCLVCPFLARAQDGDGVIWRVAAKAVKGH